jgi:hypothetical protein
MQPTLHQFPAHPVGRTRSRRWHGPAAMAVLVTALGALVGSAVSGFLEAAGVGWAGRVPLLTPLMALVAATSVYGHYRHLPLDWLQARMARAMVSTAAGILVAAIWLGEAGLAVTALWSMAGVTVIVTALAAGAGSAADARLDAGWA